MNHLHHSIVKILPESNYFKHDNSRDTFLNVFSGSKWTKSKLYFERFRFTINNDHL